MPLSKEQTLALMRCAVSPRGFEVNSYSRSVRMHKATLKSLLERSLLTVLSETQPDPRSPRCVVRKYEVTEKGVDALKEEIGSHYEVDSSIAAGEWITKTPTA